MENKTVAGYYVVDDAYAGNSKITMLDADGQFKDYTITNDYNVEGYCECLQDFGYQNYDSIVCNGDVVCIEGDNYIKKGKIYKCEHGRLFDEDGRIMVCEIKSIDDLNSRGPAKFIEVKR